MTVFLNQLRDDALPEYAELSQRMSELARSMPGFVSATTIEGSDGSTGRQRVTIVVFADEESQRAWREHPEHRLAQRTGRDRLYSTYSLYVGTVDHESHFTAD